MSNSACPKCDAAIKVDTLDLSYSGTVQHCPECKAKFWAKREDFTQRPYRKPGKIYCIDCGHELGHNDICLRCGNLFPDYYVVQTSKPAQRKQPKKAFSLLPTSEQSLESQEAFFEEDVKTRRKLNFKPLAYVTVAVLILVLVGGIGKYYGHYQARQQYSRDFVVALFGVKSGMDLCLNNANKISSAWKTSSQAIAPRLSQKELDQLDAVKVEIDKALDKLSETPEEYADSLQRLQNLYQIYLKSKALNESSPASFEELSATSAKLEKNFVDAAKRLKNGFPETLLEELTASVGKYRNLRFLVDKS